MRPWHKWLVTPTVLLSGGVVHAETYLSVAEAQSAMFPGEKLSPAPVTLSAEQAREIEKLSGVRVRVRQVRAWRSEHGGWFFVDEVLGKHEFITWSLGLNADGSVRQIEILEYRETYGSEIRNAHWRAQFVGKRPGAQLQLDKDIKNIAGATLSCRHITDGVKRLLATYAYALAR